MRRFQNSTQTIVFFGSAGVLLLMVIGVVWKWTTVRKPMVILCMGDSLTASGYPGMLQKLFESRNLKANIINRGINGHTSGEYLTFMKRENILSKDNPDMVLLMLGTNDARIDRDHTPTEQFINNMNEMVSLIQKHQSKNGNPPKLLISTIPPIPQNPPPTFDEESIRRVAEEINPVIESVAAMHHAVLVDNYRLFMEGKEMLPNIHPTLEGYERMAENWFGHIIKHLTSNSTPARISIKKGSFGDLTGKIVFQSNRDGDEEVFLLNLEGGRVIQLTSNTAIDGYPVWSADGTRIAFESNREGLFQIYVMGPDGSNQKRVTEGQYDNRFPGWSPDGKRVIYQSERKNGLQIYAMDLETKAERPMTNSWYKSGLPSWSPDGSVIAFTANKLFGWGVYIMNKDGADIRALDTEGGSCRPRWSKDASTLAYVSTKGDNKGEIWMMRRDGSNKRRVTIDPESYDYFPSWSPDGKYIAYSSTLHKERGNWEIRIIDIATGESKQITDHLSQDVYPDWR